VEIEKQSLLIKKIIQHCQYKFVIKVQLVMSHVHTHTLPWTHILLSHILLKSAAPRK